MSNSRLDQIKDVRRQKLDQLKKLGLDPYPPKYTEPSIDIFLARTKHGEIVGVTGRLMRWREHGQVVFADLKDGSGQIQLLFHEKNLPDKFALLKLFDAGDFLGATGRVITTNSGEITVEVSSFMLLTKSLRPLPDQWAGLTDEESRYRERYLDLLLSPKLVDLFHKKALFWQSMRNFLLAKGFMEVETPVLENTAGGADAKPFATHHDALDVDLYLRISMGELWQKRLMVAGFTKTFEIGRQFRNEGLSREHLQDYSQMEFYWPYANYQDSMALVEELYKHLAQTVFGTLEFQINGHQINLGQDWPRLDYTEIVFQKTGLDIRTVSDEELASYLKKNSVTISLSDDRGRLIDHVFKTFRKDLSGPAFLINHPVEVSPLAKRLPGNPNFVERYQVILAGSEMGNGYSELNDPIDQGERFVKQQQLRDTGDAEAQMNDQDFVTALEYGMPPVSGFGVSERLFSFLADKPSREAVLFPLLRPETNTTAKQDFDRKLVILIDSSLPPWQIMNTSGHVAAFLGNKMTQAFDTGKHFTTRDGINLPRNTQYPIVTLTASSSELKSLMEDVRTSGLLYIGYVPEMMVTSNDKKLAEMLSTKTESEIVYAGIGLFGPREEIDKLTKKYPLWE